MEMYASSATGKLKKAGVLLLDMVAVPHGRLYNATVWRLSMPRTAKGNRSLPYHKYVGNVCVHVQYVHTRVINTYLHNPICHHRFARGDAVLLSTQQDAPVPTTSTAASTTVARLEGLDDLESMSDEEDSVLMMSGYRYVVSWTTGVPLLPYDGPQCLAKLPQSGLCRAQ